MARIHCILFGYSQMNKIVSQHHSCTVWYVLYTFSGLKNYPMYLFLTTDHGAYHYTLASILLILANLRCVTKYLFNVMCL